MAGPAKVVSLRARPNEASHLCFPVDGILGTMDTRLGDSASNFDFEAFYATLAGHPTVSGDLSRLQYDVAAIEQAVGSHRLASLRAESLKVSLTNAILARQNVFHTKYGHIAAIVSDATSRYHLGYSGSKPERIGTLQTIADQQWSELDSAYTADGRRGVVKTTQSSLGGTVVTDTGTMTTGSTEQVGISGQAGQLPWLTPGTEPDEQSVVLAGSPGGESYDYGTSGESSTAVASATESQTITNTDYGYRVPYLEAQAQRERAQISLIDEGFSQLLASVGIGHLQHVLENELATIDGDVCRRQLALLSTMLMSPIAGTVTGVYKQPGDPVRAGEPVVRVENNSEVMLIARLIHRDVINIGDKMKIKTELYDAPGAATTATASIIAARGHTDDDQWEVVARLKNTNSHGVPLFPLNYHFDYDDTEVVIV